VLAAVLLVTWYVAGAVAGGLITAVIGVAIGGLWFGVPLVSRRRTARLSVSAECFGFPPGSTTVSAGRLGWLRFAVGKEAGRGGGNGLPGQAVVARGAAAGAW
jgi:hypothetical protein